MRSLRVIALPLSLVVVFAACSGSDAADGTTTTAGAAATITTTGGDATSSTSPSDTTASTLAGQDAVTTTLGASATTPTDDSAPEDDTTSPPATTSTTTSTTSTTTTTLPPVTTLTAVPITTTTYGGPSGPHLIIGRGVYPFTPYDCVVFEGMDAIVAGVGETPGGDPFHVSLQVNQLRVDIGADAPGERTDDYWIAGANAPGALDVTIDTFLVMAEGTFTSDNGRSVEGLLRVDCL